MFAGSNSFMRRCFAAATVSVRTCSKMRHLRTNTPWPESGLLLRPRRYECPVKHNIKLVLNAAQPGRGGGGGVINSLLVFCLCFSAFTHFLFSGSTKLKGGCAAVSSEG